VGSEMCIRDSMILARLQGVSYYMQEKK